MARLIRAHKMKARSVFAAALLLIITLACAPPNLYAQVPSNVLRRIILIQAGTQAGTAFTIEVDRRQYLVTARHVVSGLKPEDTIEYFKDNLWKKLAVKVVRYPDENAIDIAILVPPKQITVDLPLEATSQTVYLGQDVYLVGFPLGFGSNAPASINAGFPIPFVARGTFAAQINNAGTSVMIIDGMVNHGLSGAPVVYRDLNQQGNVFKIAAVVQGFKNDGARVLQREQEVDPKIVTPEGVNRGEFVQQDGHWYQAKDAGESVNLNTGIGIAYNISQAIELIRRNDLSGPVVSDTFEPQSP